MSERIPKGWKRVKLGEVGNVITGKTPSKNNPEDWGKDTLFITPTDFGNYRKWAEDSIRKLSVKGVERLSKKLLPINSILVTCIGSDMGKVVMNRKKAVTNQQINSIVPNTEIINPHFGYYLLVSMYDTLRVYGGDGTVSDTAAAISTLEEKPLLAFIPTGSGNDWIKSIGFTSTSIDSSISAIVTGNIKSVDTGMCSWENGSKFFLNSAGIGFDAFVLKNAISVSSVDA